MHNVDDVAELALVENGCPQCQDVPGGCGACRHTFSDIAMGLDWLQAPGDEDCRRYGCTAAHIDGLACDAS